MNEIKKQFGEVAAARVAAGHALFALEGVGWFSAPVGAEPASAFWGSGIAKHQLGKVASDKAAIAKMAVGDNRRCTAGYHPRHGEKTRGVTRVA